MNPPAPVNPALARAAVAEFFEDKGWKRRIAENGWAVARVAPLSVVARLPLRGGAENAAEEYTLLLTCDYYPTHPPDVRFVDPDTLEYDPTRDQGHLPILQAPYCYLHPVYTGYPADYPYGPQLVCSSMTLGYYFSGHAPTPEQAWDPGRHTLGTSLSTVYQALRSEHYRGRSAG